MSKHLAIHDEVLTDFCQKHHVRRLALFGSTLHRTTTPDSDIDLLVGFEPGHEPGLLAFAEMEMELSMLLGGTKVVLRTLLELSRYFRDEVMATAETQYAA